VSNYEEDESVNFSKNSVGGKSLFDSLLVIGSDANGREQLCSALTGFGCKARFADNFEEAKKLFQIMPRIDVVLIDVPSGGIVNDTFDFVRQLRLIDGQATSVFVICDQSENNFMHAFYEGINGVFVRPFDLGSFTKALAIAYSELLGHKERKFRRYQVARVKIKYSVEGHASEGFAGNISLGGLFVGSNDPLPAIGETILFKMTRTFPNMDLVGSGIIKWVRPEIMYGRPRGFGIEFVDVDRTMLSKFI
jgi:CheY-like chemotaxis protein